MKKTAEQKTDIEAVKESVKPAKAKATIHQIIKAKLDAIAVLTSMARKEQWICDQFIDMPEYPLQMSAKRQIQVALDGVSATLSAQIKALSNIVEPGNNESTTEAQLEKLTRIFTVIGEGKFGLKKYFF